MILLSGTIVPMTDEKEYLPKSAMSIHAHPDDQDFTVAGTLAKWAQAGCEIVTVIITDGSAGSNDPVYPAGSRASLSNSAAWTEV